MPESLTTSKIVDTLVGSNGYSRPQAKALVDAMLEIIMSSLASGEDLLISRFGKFCVKDKQQRRGRNPVSGKPLTLPARRVVTFRCSKKLKTRLNRHA